MIYFKVLLIFLLFNCLLIIYFEFCKLLNITKAYRLPTVINVNLNIMSFIWNFLLLIHIGIIKTYINIFYFKSLSKVKIFSLIKIFIITSIIIIILIFIQIRFIFIYFLYKFYKVSKMKDIDNDYFNKFYFNDALTLESIYNDHHERCDFIVIVVNSSKIAYTYF